MAVHASRTSWFTNYPGSAHLPTLPQYVNQPDGMITSWHAIHSVLPCWANVMFPIGMASAAIPNWYIPELFRFSSILSHPRPPCHISAHRACRWRAMGNVPKRCHPNCARPATGSAPWKRPNVPAGNRTVTDGVVGINLRLVRDQFWLETLSRRHKVATTYKDFPLFHYSIQICLDSSARLFSTAQVFHFECPLPQQRSGTSAASHHTNPISPQSVQTVKCATDRPSFLSDPKGERKTGENFSSVRMHQRGIEPRPVATLYIKLS
ncbi:hypothetical protein DFH08DRAFT_823980 [Mycena albidolilacea]|uniref:Uncharacterized protein n=1 Tax=Mycena albidolilacea TaxID=1033008 RepID=A0AAD6Z4X3_9AGAR|nr:hypothetical protein DFH08DRAFT_823980 [Mycena albidolilacea]